MGVDRVMLGSDYPFPLGEQNIGELLREHHLPWSEREKIMGSNANDFFGLNLTDVEKKDESFTYSKYENSDDDPTAAWYRSPVAA